MSDQVMERGTNGGNVDGSSTESLERLLNAPLPATGEGSLGSQPQPCVHSPVVPPPTVLDAAETVTDLNEEAAQEPRESTEAGDAVGQLTGPNASPSPTSLPSESDSTSSSAAATPPQDDTAAPAISALSSTNHSLSSPLPIASPQPPLAVAQQHSAPAEQPAAAAAAEAGRPSVASPRPLSTATVVSPSSSATPPGAVTQRNTDSAATTTTITDSVSEDDILKWRESKDYLRLQRDLGRLLATMHRTALADWATQAALLTQLQKLLHTFKDVVGAVELPDGEHFAKCMWRALSPQAVVGVQRKALEVLQSYARYANPAYPMSKDLASFLPCLLELLPQATMQVKWDVLELLDGGIVRRLPPGALRGCAQGLLTALLSCLEESETSTMFRRAMALLLHVHATLRREDTVSAAARQLLTHTVYAAELRGGQVLPAYAWVLVRDAATLRPAALLVLKAVMAEEAAAAATRTLSEHSSLPPVECARTEPGVDGETAVVRSTPISPPPEPAQHCSAVCGVSGTPDWVGGNAGTVAAALFNCLLDSQEKAHRLALDMLALICPLGSRVDGSDGVQLGAVVASRLSYTDTLGGGTLPARSPTTATVPCVAAPAMSSLPHSATALPPLMRHERFSFEVKARLVAAAVQLLGTRHGTPSVARRVYQWLAVDPRHDGGLLDPSQQQQQPQHLEHDYGLVDASPDTAADAANAYVRDISAYLLSQGFHTVVQQWESRWVKKDDTKARATATAAATTAATTAAKQQQQQQVEGEEEAAAAAQLSALQHAARSSSLLFAAPPRPPAVVGVGAAASRGQGNSLSAGDAAAMGGQRAGDASPSSSQSSLSVAAEALATPLVWLRALLVLFRYRASSSSSSPSSAPYGGVMAGDAGSVPTGSPAAQEPPAQSSAAEATESDVNYPFLRHVAPLVLPSLSRLLTHVPGVVDHVSDRTARGTAAQPAMEVWNAEVRELLRVLPWTAWVRLDEMNLRAVEKLITPLLATAVTERDSSVSKAGERASVSVSSAATQQLRHRIRHNTNQVQALASALEALLMEATAEQPLAAQAYVRASLSWADEVARMLGDVVDAIAAMHVSAAAATAAAATGEHNNNGGGEDNAESQRCTRLLLLSTASGLLRLLVQRMQRLLDPMLDIILATATATGSASATAPTAMVMEADFLSSFLSLVDTRVLQQLRRATVHLTDTLLPSVSDLGRSMQPGAAASRHGEDVQRLLSGLHATTLRFTSSLTQLHLRCQQQAMVGVLLDSTSDDRAGSRERALVIHTTQWLTCLCRATAVAAAAAAAGGGGAWAFFLREAMELLLNVLLRARGCLLPEPAYLALEPSCPSAGDGAETVALAQRFLLAPVVRSLWAACCDHKDSAATVSDTHDGGGSGGLSSSPSQPPDVVAMCTEMLVVLVAVSPPCARCLDVEVLSTAPVDEAALCRLLRLHRTLANMRAQQRRGQALGSPAFVESSALAVLHDPGVFFLGTLTVLDCLSDGGDGWGGAAAAVSTRQLARGYVLQAVTRDLPGILLPLFSSFLCPLLLLPPPPPSSTSATQRKDAPVSCAAGNNSNSRRDDTSGNSAKEGALNTSARASPTPPFSALSLTVLLPVPHHASSSLSASTHAEQAGAAPLPGPPRTYRTLEAVELVRHLTHLLQLPTAAEWVRQSMQLPTPNGVRVLLRALEAQSFSSPEAGSPGQGSAVAPSSASPTAAPAREGPSDTLFAATALLLLNLSRQSLLSVHWSWGRRCEEAGQGRGAIAEPSQPRGPSSSLLHDSLACLNRLLDLSLTSSRMQPQRTAVLTWQFTSTQLLPLLRLAVVAGLHLAQSLLLHHLRCAVLYLDDAGTRTGAAVVGDDGVFVSRHWRHHALLQVGLASGGRAYGRGTSSAGEFDSQSSGAGGASEAVASEASATPVLDDLKRVPPTVLTNRLLYAIIGEVVERVVTALCRRHHYQPARNKNNTTISSGGTQSMASPAAVPTDEMDTLALWLRFFRDVMPYLYRELIPAAEAVVDVLLGALEAPVTQGGAPLQQACYAALMHIAQFLCNVARAADVEAYEAAVKARESRSWIASTFAADDAVAQAPNSTLWARSTVLAPLRIFLPRLVAVAVRCLMSCDERAASAGSTRAARWSVEERAWGVELETESECDDNEEEERGGEERGLAMGWQRSSFVEKQPPMDGQAAAEVREQARDLLRFLHHAAGAPFMDVFLDHWCRQYAGDAALWMFETAAQRRVREQIEATTRNTHAQRTISRGHHSKGKDEHEDTRTRRAAWAAKHAAQRAAMVLLEDVRVPVMEVAAALSPLLRTATERQQRADQDPQQPHKAQKTKKKDDDNGHAGRRGTTQPSPPPPPTPRATQLLYFLDQLVEGCCVSRSGGLSEREGEAVLAMLAEAISQGPPSSLSCCCVLHTLYCVVDYAHDRCARHLDRASATPSPSPAPPKNTAAPVATAPLSSVRVFQSRDYTFTLCRLLEGMAIDPAVSQRSPTLLLLHVLCQTVPALIPLPLNSLENPGRLVDAATRVFQRCLLPVLRRGIASESEAEIVVCAPLVQASLRVLRSVLGAFAADLTFAKRVQRDLMTLFFSEHFFRFSRGALHEWALLLRQMCVADHDFHNVLCERMVPAPGRLSAILMSRETEALLRSRSLRSLAFYTYAMMASEEQWCRAGSNSSNGSKATSASASAAPTAALLACHKELLHLLREQLTITFQQFAPPVTPTAALVQSKEALLQPLTAAFVVFRVLLICNARESFVAALWPLVWPELLRALSITTPLTGHTASGKDGPAEGSSNSEALLEILRLQMEALKVLDVDYTLYPAHALAFRWLFADDSALMSVMVLHQQQRHYRSQQGRNAPPKPSPLSLLLHASSARRYPLVSHLEALSLLRSRPPLSADAYLNRDAVLAAVHEPRLPHLHDTDTNSSSENSPDGDLAPVLSTIRRTWPSCHRPPANDTGVRRPLLTIPSTHYPRLASVGAAAQAFTVLLQRLNHDALPHAGDGELGDAQRLAVLQTAVEQCVGCHSEVDVAFMQDLVEADLTTTDPDTML